MTELPDLADTELVDALRAHGRRITVQRLILHRQLREAAGHVTADELARRAAKDLPGLSTPTVYAALDLLCDLGLARRVDAGGPTRFEAAGPPHQHRRCTQCGRIDDLDVDIPTSTLRLAADRDGFAADSVQVLVTGLCASCRAVASPP